MLTLSFGQEGITRIEEAATIICLRRGEGISTLDIDIELSLSGFSNAEIDQARARANRICPEGEPGLTPLDEIIFEICNGRKQGVAENDILQRLVLSNIGAGLIEAAIAKANQICPRLAPEPIRPGAPTIVTFPTALPITPIPTPTQPPEPTAVPVPTGPPRVPLRPTPEKKSFLLPGLAIGAGVLALGAIVYVVASRR